MTGMARTAALKNGLVFLSLTPPQAGYWCSRFARRPDVSLIWRGKRPDHGNGLRPRIPKQPLEFYSCATKSHPLTRTCPCEPVTRRVWAPIGERPIAHGHHRFDWLYVTAFVSPATGEIFWYLSDGMSKEFFEVLLETLVPDGQHLAGEAGTKPRQAVAAQRPGSKSAAAMSPLRDGEGRP
jgi:hypothetical protein